MTPDQRMRFEGLELPTGPLTLAQHRELLARIRGMPGTFDYRGAVEAAGYRGALGTDDAPDADYELRELRAAVGQGRRETTRALDRAERSRPIHFGDRGGDCRMH